MRERGDLQALLSRYGAIDETQGPPWDDVELVTEIARAYSLVGDEAKVERYYLRCAELNPRRGAIYRCQIGWFFQRKKRWARALTWYDRAIETFPAYHLCLFRKGYCLERLHRPRAAAEALEAAAASFSHASAEQQERGRGIQIQVLFHFARNLREIGETERARGVLDQCASIDDRAGELVIKMEHRLASYGETYLREGDAPEAIRYLEEARALDERSAVIWERLGRAYEHAQRFEDAEAALRRAADLPRGAVALISLGRFMIERERLTEGAETLILALREHPQGEVQIRIELAALQVRLGRPQAAVEELERLSSGRVPPQSTLSRSIERQLARILVDHGHLSRALAALESAFAGDPLDTSLQEWIADVRARLDRDEERTRPPRPLVDAPLSEGFEAILGAEPQRLAGKVTSYFSDRGFGFIQHGDEAESVFFHVSHCELGPGQTLTPGTRVSFSLGTNQRTRKPQAEQIRLARAAASSDEA